jgi:hypothetical protein
MPNNESTHSPGGIEVVTYVRAPVAFLLGFKHQPPAMVQTE